MRNRRLGQTALITYQCPRWPLAQVDCLRITDLAGAMSTSKLNEIAVKVLPGLDIARGLVARIYIRLGTCQHRALYDRIDMRRGLTKGSWDSRKG